MAVEFDMLNRPVVWESLHIQRAKEKRGKEGGGERERERERERATDGKIEEKTEDESQLSLVRRKQAENVLDLSLLGPKPVFLP